MPATPSRSDPPYRLDELGWLQFDRLCELVLAVLSGRRELAWTGASDRWRTTTVAGRLDIGGAPQLTGPVTCASLWIPDVAEPAARAGELNHRLLSLLDSETPVAQNLLVLTNLDPEPIGTVLRAAGFIHHREMVLAGPRQLCEVVARHPQLRAALPSTAPTPISSGGSMTPTVGRSSSPMTPSAPLSTAPIPRSAGPGRWAGC